MVYNSVIYQCYITWYISNIFCSPLAGLLPATDTDAANLLTASERLIQHVKQ